MDVDDAKEIAWHIVAAGAVIAALTFGFFALLAPKNVDYYYLSHGTGNRSNASCVYAHWTWHTDEVSFCTDDYQKALDFTAKANAGLKR